MPKTPTLTPLPYQRQAIDFIKAHAGCGLFLDVGLGKTATVLQFLYEENAPANVLIIAPKNIALATWPDEIEKWNFPFSWTSLVTDKNGKKLKPKARDELLYKIRYAKHPRLYIANREIVTKIVDFYVDHDYDWPFPIVIIDELQSFKSYASSRFKSLKKVRPQIARLIGMTGTPIPNGLEDIWAEIWLMDRGWRLGKNITQFRNTFFYAYTRNAGFGQTYNEYELKDGAEEEIWQRISDIVISMSNGNVDFPKATYNDVILKMTSKEKEKYKQFATDYILEGILTPKDEKSSTFESDPKKVTTLDNTILIEAKNAAILSGKLRQMASGTIYTNRDPDTQDPNIPEDAYACIHDHKIEALEDIAKDTDGPILVCYQFRCDRDRLLSHFDGSTHKGERRPKAIAFDSAHAAEMVHAWNKGEYEMMLIQPASAGHGLNLQEGGHTLVWYTLPWSLEEYLQAQGRLVRKGQTKPVVIHRLMTEGTIDQKVLHVLSKKRAQQDALLDAVSLGGPTWTHSQDALWEQDAVADTLAELFPDMNITFQEG